MGQLLLLFLCKFQNVFFNFFCYAVGVLAPNLFYRYSITIVSRFFAFIGYFHKIFFCHELICTRVLVTKFFLRSILFEETSYDVFSKNLKVNVILRNLVAKFRTGDTLDGAARCLRDSWCWPSRLKQSE